MNRTFNELIWQEVFWARPFSFESILEFLTHMAGIQDRGPVIWEARGSGGKVRYLIGCEKRHANKIRDTFKAHGNITFSEYNETKRADIAVAKQLKISHPTLSLKTDGALAVARASLAALTQTKPGEETVLQIILGHSFSPSLVPNKLSDPHASWLNVALGNVAPASNESRNLIKEKISYHGFSCVVRIGAVSKRGFENTLIRNLCCALRVLESSGVRISNVDDRSDFLNSAKVPWQFPMRLSVKELANLFLLPHGEEELPGAAGLNPRILTPPAWLQTQNNNECHFAESIDFNKKPTKNKIGISPRDSLEHTIILGPTGSGKSNAMLSLILANIEAGRGIMVIDPKSDLINEILSRIPKSREDDVVVIDPSDPSPVGVNPFSLGRSQNPELIADAILAVFKEIFAENWGIRSQDILSSALLTLARVDGASLLLLPALLTDDNFRQRIVKNIDDKIGLEPFWAHFDAMGAAERSQVIAPVLNKIRQFLLRPGLRNVLGQAHPKFSLSDLYDKRRIVLVPLNKGIIGAESARLLGSLIVSLTWTLALNRAKESPEKRHIVNIFIDELQNYLSLPTDLPDALAQARGLGVGLVLAHQYRNQLTPSVRSGIDANARNKIVFGLNSGDAKDMADMAPELTATDFMLLPRYQIYTSLQSGGKSTGWISGQTLPPTPAFSSAAEIKAKSMQRYGQDINELRLEYLNTLGYTQENISPITDSAKITTEVEPESPKPLGRKKRP